MCLTFEFQGRIVIASRCMRHVYTYLHERFGSSVKSSESLIVSI